MVYPILPAFVIPKDVRSTNSHSMSATVKTEPTQTVKTLGKKNKRYGRPNKNTGSWRHIR